MSTRYVYNIYNTTVETRKAETKVSLRATDDYDAVIAVFCTSYESEVAYNRGGNPVTKYTGTGRTLTQFISNDVHTTNQYFAYDTSEYKYVTVTCCVNDNRDIVLESYLLDLTTGVSGAFWHIAVLGQGVFGVDIWNNNNSSIANGENLKTFFKSGGIIAKGNTVLKTESSNSALATGAFEESGAWKWRSYQGADNIDPYSVSYSEAELQAGEPVIASVSPRQPTYGGTVYYQYQYSTNGGTTWYNAGGKTTATSKTVTIPEGAEQFRARVQASDNWGFTSTTYVYGENLPVSQIKAYAAVGGKLRSGAKIYAAVGGKIRQIQKGYATVGGKIRKMF